MNRRNKIGAGVGRQLAVLAALLAVSGTASAGLYNDGKVLATGGVSMTDGAGGGGITPWATITGYETRDGINADLHYTYVHLPNYDLNSGGIAIGFFDRVELSYTNDSLPTGNTYDTVGLLTTTVNNLLTVGSTPANTLNTGIEPFNTTVRMNVFGAKIRLFGEAIYDSDNLIPQVAIGGFYKINNNKLLLKTLGADKSKDFEAYVSVTKIFFPLSTLINLTGRYTSANQTGLVGFGGPDGNHRSFRFEGSIAYLLNKGTAIGAEYQMHSDKLHNVNLNILGLTANTGNALLDPILNTVTGSTLRQRESDWRDAFIAFFPSKNLSITMAYAMLGNIVLSPHQDGYYISLQASF
ncbi:MAG: hypothetical protein JWR16_3358 [Nevskia sp.]|nr:hypothetical protein [Nevskia sp.]